jgi:ABC-2 type transport system ATP-binding protein
MTSIDLDAVENRAGAVRVIGLRVRFGRLAAVDDVDLHVDPGQALALVGRNGAGKSTTMRVLAGVLPADAGSVFVAGHDARRHPLAARAVVGYCPDVGGLLPRVTGWEHLQLAARLRGLTDWQPRAVELLQRFDLTDAADRVCGAYSHGMGRRFSVLLAAFHHPPVVLLDEPFDGVDPLGVEATLELVAELRAAGSALVISTHLLDLAAQACPDAVVLRQGQVVARTATETLQGEHGHRTYQDLLR